MSSLTANDRWRLINSKNKIISTYSGVIEENSITYYSFIIMKQHNNDVDVKTVLYRYSKMLRIFEYVKENYYSLLESLSLLNFPSKLNLWKDKNIITIERSEYFKSFINFILNMHPPNERLFKMLM